MSDVKETITLADVLNAIDSFEVFSFEACTADIERGTGGKLIAYNRATKHVRQKAVNHNMFEEPKVRRDPAHYHNSTRNLYIINERIIVKVHIRLITLFNGKRVL